MVSMQISRQLLIALIILVNAKVTCSTSCFCHESECCSRWGYCGKTDEYCGAGCQSGPCKAKIATQPSVSLTFDVFECAFPNLDLTVRSRRFNGLIEAAEQMKWHPTNEIEVAIFFAHVSHETDGLHTLVEYCAKHGSCNNYQSSWCDIEAYENVQYYGRGWFQLSYPCNYYNAGKALGLDLLRYPEMVSESEKVAAATAIWYFKETGMDLLAQRGQFANTTRKLNEYECRGRPGYPMQASRIKAFQRILSCFTLPQIHENLIC